LLPTQIYTQLKNKIRMKELLIKLDACKEAIEWAGDRTIEEIVKDCDRGDWLFWLAKKIDIELQPLTLANGHCANTVRHLMKNERSITGVDMAIAFGEGRATMEELNNAYAATAAATAAFYVAADAAATAYAAKAAFTAYAATAAASAAFYAAYAGATAAAPAYVAKKQNQKETAEICRKYIGQLIIDKCNELNTAYLEIATNLIKNTEIMSTENRDQEEKSNELYTLSPAVLDEIIEYIEETDQIIEFEWGGSCRSLQEVKDAKGMPDIYYKLIALKNGG
jgi:hypothetical protein